MGNEPSKKVFGGKRSTGNYCSFGPHTCLCVLCAAVVFSLRFDFLYSIFHLLSHRSNMHFVITVRLVKHNYRRDFKEIPPERKACPYRPQRERKEKQGQENGTVRIGHHIWTSDWPGTTSERSATGNDHGCVVRCSNQLSY